LKKSHFRWFIKLECSHLKTLVCEVLILIACLIELPTISKMKTCRRYFLVTECLKSFHFSYFLIIFFKSSWRMIYFSPFSTFDGWLVTFEVPLFSFWLKMIYCENPKWRSQQCRFKEKLTPGQMTFFFEFWGPTRTIGTEYSSFPENVPLLFLKICLSNFLSYIWFRALVFS